MLAHLYTGAPAPAEYIELALCREFHVLPSQLRAEPAANLVDVLAMQAVEHKVERQRRRGRK